MDWTPENRLKVIRELVALSYNDPAADQDLMIRIMFLCDMSEEFLTQNVSDYRDAIKSLERGGLTVEL